MEQKKKMKILLSHNGKAVILSLGTASATHILNLTGPIPVTNYLQYAWVTHRRKTLSALTFSSIFKIQFFALNKKLNYLFF